MAKLIICQKAGASKIEGVEIILDPVEAARMATGLILSLNRFEPHHVSIVTENKEIIHIKMEKREDEDKKKLK